MDVGLRGHVERAVSLNQPVPRQVRIRQRGEMWLKPGGRAMAFTAVQSFAVERVAFAWQARFPLLGPLALRVVDDYADGDGKLEVRALGIPLQRQRGPETTAGEALRYLAELPFVPHAIAHNPELRWRGLDERCVQVSTEVNRQLLIVELALAAEGDIVGASSQMRQRKVGDEWVAAAWGGRYGDYRAIGPIRMPTVAEAYWELPGGRYVYWRGAVTSARLLDEPFGSSANTNS